jgi:hypothetical protein
MISLNPSGFACSFNEAALENLSNDNGGKKEFSANRTRRGRFYIPSQSKPFGLLL